MSPGQPPQNRTLEILLLGMGGISSAKVYLGESDTNTNPCSGAQKAESIHQAGPTSLAGTCYQKNDLLKPLFNTGF